jgi:AraC family transcriptional regulator
MTAVAKVIWYIESHLKEAVTLDEVADVAGLSKFHLTRAFAFVTNHSVFGYARARRLTIAAKTLADGAPDILAVALDAGYASHEAFTRAFRDRFGITPESVRAGQPFDPNLLQEPFVMPSNPKQTLAKPRIEHRDAFIVAGLSRHYTMSERGKIPSQWQEFVPYIGNIPGQKSFVAYGLCTNTDDKENMDYMCAVEVADFECVPKELDRLRVPAARYAVFNHDGHVSAIPDTWTAIFSSGLAGLTLAEGPMFERYGEDFDGKTGLGPMEIWIPVA